MKASAPSVSRKPRFVVSTALRYVDEMILRIWRAAVDPTRWDDYTAFEREHSRPMFELLPGCLGVFFVRTESGAAAITLWRDQAAIDALGSSALYRATVQRLVDSGLLRGEQTVEVLPAAGHWLSPLTLQSRAIE
jgi:hypothetical protein